jgi:hypothetical protein
VGQQGALPFRIPLAAGARASSIRVGGNFPKGFPESFDFLSPREKKKGGLSCFLRAVARRRRRFQRFTTFDADVFNPWGLKEKPRRGALAGQNHRCNSGFRR